MPWQVISIIDSVLRLCVIFILSFSPIPEGRFLCNITFYV